MKKEFQRLEDSMNKGFSDIKAELKILNRSYVSKEEMKEETQKLCDMVDKKASIWVETTFLWILRIIVGAVVIALLGLILVDTSAI